MTKTEHWRKTASREVTRQQTDVLAFADRNREIVELPEGLETTARRLVHSDGQFYDVVTRDDTEVWFMVG
jgi:hypothetical protein